METAHFGRLLLIVIAGFMGIITGVIVLARQVDTGSADFLTEYARVFPGQSRSELAALGFACGPGSDLCGRNMDSEILLYIDALMCEEVVCSISYFLHKQAMNIGSLAGHWGKPNIRISGQTAYLDWPELGVSCVADTIWGRFSYHLPVRWIRRVAVPSASGGPETD